MASRSPAKALQYVGDASVAGAAISALAVAYPRRIARSSLADIVYADRPDGGPSNASNTIAASLSRYRHRLRDFGWSVSSAGSGMVGLVPVDREDEERMRAGQA